MKIVIVTHGKFGIELLESAKMIIGQVSNMTAVAFTLDDSLESLKVKIENSIENEKEILILTDIKGGTPFNVSYLLSTINSNIEVMYGVNLPLVLSVSTLMSSGVSEFDSIFDNYNDLIGKIEEE
ncbi:MAG: PTS sugar transporter subunit IIA [Bacilli bacterium]